MSSWVSRSRRVSRNYGIHTCASIRNACWKSTGDGSGGAYGTNLVVRDPNLKLVDDVVRNLPRRDPLQERHSPGGRNYTWHAYSQANADIAAFRQELKRASFCTCTYCHHNPLPAKLPCHSRRRHRDLLFTPTRLFQFLRKSLEYTMA